MLWRLIWSENWRGRQRSEAFGTACTTSLRRWAGAEALKRHNDNTQATYLKQGLLDRKTKELLIIVACVASGDLVSHIQIHMHAAQKAGATPEEIMEALNLVGSWIGIRRLLGLEAWRATFRPDLPTIDRVVELQ